eukprot:39203_1
MANRIESESTELHHTSIHDTKSKPVRVSTTHQMDQNDNTETAEQRAHYWDYLSFGWLSQMFETGQVRSLEMTDLNYLQHSDHSENLFMRFDQSWKALQRSNDRTHRQTSSVFKAIISSFGKPYLIAIPLKFIYDILQYTGPIFLGRFIEASEQNN